MLQLVIRHPHTGRSQETLEEGVISIMLKCIWCWRATLGVFLSLTSESGVPKASPSSFTSCQNLGKGLVCLVSFSCVVPVGFPHRFFLSAFHLHRSVFGSVCQFRISGKLKFIHLQKDSPHRSRQSEAGQVNILIPLIVSVRARITTAWSRPCRRARESS